MKRFGLIALLLSCMLAVNVPGAAAQQTLTPPRVAYTTPVTATSAHRVYGPVHYGHDFNLNMTTANFAVFDSDSAAAQTVIAGQADVVGGSLVSILLLREAGQNFKVFCPLVSHIDYILVGRNGVTKIDQLLDPKVRVAVNSPGSGGDVVMNALLQINKMNATAGSLPNTVELGSSSLRLAAWASNKVDATTLQLNQFRQVEKTIPDATIIARLYDSIPDYLHTVYSAPESWLNANLDSAAAFCAATIEGAQRLSSDFDLYYSAITESMSKPPAKDSLKEVFGMITQYDFWALKLGIQPSSITFMAQIAKDGGELKNIPDPTDVLDNRPYTMALELLKNALPATEESK